ncbi:MAG: Spy/CpxP family protein refolding chaperone [Cyanobacteria bacterium J06626_18]
MKRTVQLGLAGILTAATVFVAPFVTQVAIAQTFPILEELDLTEEQRTQIRDNFEDRRAEIEDILTDEQRQQFREAYEESQDFRTAAAAVDDLSEDQKESVQGVFQATREDLSEILTEEQQAELRSIVAERRQNRR